MKQKVYYDDQMPVLEGYGGSAYLYPVDHPDTTNVSNTTVARTSKVVSWNKETGVIETLNTIYTPISQKEPS